MTEPTPGDIKDFYEKAYENPNPDRERAGNFSTAPSEEYQRLLMTKIHPELLKVNFGCGSPFPSGDLTGFNVVDLGSGSGRDCFIMSALTGDTGRVMGVDFSQKVVDLANTYKDYHKDQYGLKKDIVEFKQGNIEDLKACGIEDSSTDLVISNCVVNLAKSKENVFREVHRVLKTGGELFFSDIYTSARLGKNVKESRELWGSCYAGALYLRDFHKMLRGIGFSNFQIVTARIVKKSKLLDAKLEDRPTLFYSITLRAFKMENSEDGEEDFGQTATYIGEKFGDEFLFNKNTRFKRGIPQKVSGNTADILRQSKYGKYFKITERGYHRGRFLESTYWDILDEVEKNTKDESIGKKKCQSGKCMLAVEEEGEEEEEEEEESSCCGGKKKEKKEEGVGGSCCGGKKKEESSCCGGKKKEKKEEGSCCGGVKKESSSCCGGVKKEKKEVGSCCGGKK